MSRSEDVLDLSPFRVLEKFNGNHLVQFFFNQLKFGIGLFSTSFLFVLKTIFLKSRAIKASKLQYEAGHHYLRGFS
ncbi:MAG: hypothetical protein EA411_12605 [Saprospirales bacterium]|nr:MAG: hypothetical protein EA411_12605 [Saprospirales bacterium]